MKKGDLAKAMGKAKKAKQENGDAVMPLHKDYKNTEKDPKLKKIYDKILKSNRKRLQTGKTSLNKQRASAKKWDHFDQDKKTAYKKKGKDM